MTTVRDGTAFLKDYVPLPTREHCGDVIVRLIPLASRYKC